MPKVMVNVNQKNALKEISEVCKAAKSAKAFIDQLAEEDYQISIAKNQQKISYKISYKDACNIVTNHYKTEMKNIKKKAADHNIEFSEEEKQLINFYM